MRMWLFIRLKSCNAKTTQDWYSTAPVSKRRVPGQPLAYARGTVPASQVHQGRNLARNIMPSPEEFPVHDKTSYLNMLWASLAFAVMAAFSHRAGESCDWQLVVVARAVVAFFFAAIIAW